MSVGVTATAVASAQRRALVVLSLAQALGGLGFTIGIAAAPLLAWDLSGSESMAGLAQTSQVLGAAVASYLIARTMGRRGRRIGLTAGLLVGALGAVIIVLAGVVGSMALLLAGALAMGATTAAGLGARFAATDLAQPSTRARALSIVVWSTTIGAVLGPNLSGPADEAATGVGLPALTGPFALGALGILAAALVLWVLLRPDPLLLARELAGTPETPHEGGARANVRAVVRERPVIGAAVAGLAAAHAVMVAVMVMTPLHMQHGGAGLRVIGLVISVHVAGMFAFAPLVGWAADRLGRDRVLAAGGLVLLVALALSGLSPAGASGAIFVGLFLLGLGWSMATVAASALVSEHTPLEHRTEVQGSADLVMGLTAATAGALSGVVVSTFGFPALAGVTALLALVVVGSAVAVRALTPAPAS